MQTNLTKKQILKALPSVDFIYATISLSGDDEQTIKITKTQIKHFLDGFGDDDVMSRVVVYTKNGIKYISI